MDETAPHPRPSKKSMTRLVLKGRKDEKEDRASKKARRRTTKLLTSDRSTTRKQIKVLYLKPKH